MEVRVQHHAPDTVIRGRAPVLGGCVGSRARLDNMENKTKKSLAEARMRIPDRPAIMSRLFGVR